MPTRRLAFFGADIGRARDLVGLGQSIGGMTQGLVDSSDLYRAALVQAVSALDQYIHGVVLDRAVDVILGRRAGGSDARFGLPISAVREILAASSQTQELTIRARVSQSLNKETFQRPDDIAKALAMVGISGAWGAALGHGAAPLRTSLGLVVNRRNQIVHQCDADPLTPGSPTSLNAADSLQAIGTIEAVVTAIDPLCS